MDTYMLIREVADALDIDRRQLDNWRRAGKIETKQFRPGGPREVNVQSLYRFMAEYRDHWGSRTAALEKLVWDRHHVRLDAEIGADEC